MCEYCGSDGRCAVCGGEGEAPPGQQIDQAEEVLARLRREVAEQENVVRALRGGDAKRPAVGSGRPVASGAEARPS